MPSAQYPGTSDPGTAPGGTSDPGTAPGTLAGEKTLWWVVAHECVCVWLRMCVHACTCKRVVFNCTCVQVLLPCLSAHTCTCVFISCMYGWERVCTWLCIRVYMPVCLCMPGTAYTQGMWGWRTGVAKLTDEQVHGHSGRTRFQAKVHLTLLG